MRREVAKDGGVADGEGDHLLLRVGLDHHRLQDVPDRVERVLGQVGRGQGAPPLLVVPHLVGLIIGSRYLGSESILAVGGRVSWIVLDQSWVEVDRSDAGVRMRIPWMSGSLS